VTRFSSRLGVTAKTLPRPALCDVWLADDHRFGDELHGLGPEDVLGRWPDELETDAAVRLDQVIGEAPTWDTYATTPPVAQRLAERARLQPLDLEILQHLQHLQHVCHRPRLNLRIEEERLPVSRARRTPVRAVADLVSHPGDWEHRTLRSIQPSRILARQIEDEWDLYENRVAVRLVDHLLAYLAKRLEELRRIKTILDASRDYSDEIRRTSFRRANRISALWSSTLESKTEAELGHTVQRLELAQRSLQVLLDAPLYQRIPGRHTVALSLKPTNILVNDPHYRKVAALWRAWVKFGHKRQETHQQRTARRRREATAWDHFVLHLVIRAFDSLAWSAARNGLSGWQLRRDNWSSVAIDVDEHGVVSLRADARAPLRLLPLCATFAAVDVQALADQLAAWDALEGGLVAVHVGAPVDLADVDRATGWSFGGRAVLFSCSPWGIDSEERMARLLNGWLSRTAVPDYPITTAIQALPSPPRHWTWLRYEGPYVVVLRAPSADETGTAQAWASAQARELQTKADQAKLARQAVEIAPRQAISAFQQLVVAAATLAGMASCPVCGADGHVEPRLGKKPDGSDATWWARCGGCGSTWGLRPCTICGRRYRAISAQSGIDVGRIAETTSPRDWPDKVLGRDLWAQPCSTGAADEFRCPNCGICSEGACERCRMRGGTITDAQRSGST